MSLMSHRTRPLLVRSWDWGEEGESRLGVANPGLWDVPQSPAEAGVGVGWGEGTEARYPHLAPPPVGGGIPKLGAEPQLCS